MVGVSTTGWSVLQGRMWWKVIATAQGLQDYKALLPLSSRVKENGPVTSEEDCGQEHMLKCFSNQTSPVDSRSPALMQLLTVLHCQACQFSWPGTAPPTPAPPHPQPQGRLLLSGRTPYLLLLICRLTSNSEKQGFLSSLPQLHSPAEAETFSLVFSSTLIWSHKTPLQISPKCF